MSKEKISTKERRSSSPAPRKETSSNEESGVDSKLSRFAEERSSKIPFSGVAGQSRKRWRLWPRLS